MQAPTEPGTGDKLDYTKLTGCLLHLTIHEIVRDVQTVHGVSDAVRANVAVLDGNDKGETLENVLIFPKVLQGQLSGFAGATDPTVIGRLGQGIAKPGKSAPWVLTPPTAEDLAVGERYEAYAAERAAKVAEPF